jgi:cytochrome c-type biogenesis protein CcmH/NrfF
MPRLVEQHKRELAELVADGCTDDEIIEALVSRYGWPRLMLRIRAYEKELDEQARREEWREGDDV